MFPELLHIGPFILPTTSVFNLLAFLVTCFVFWRRSREEHYKEDQLFDGLLLSFFVGLLASRIGYVVLNIHTFGANVGSWFNIISHPGLSGAAGLLGGALYLKRFAKQNKLDPYEVLDFAVTAASLGAAFVWLGRFFEGSSVGLPTSLPIGIQFPSLLEPHHPVQLYFVVFFLFLFQYLNWAEYHYRTFAWYKVSKKTAQTGYLTSAFVIATSGFSLLVSWLQPEGSLLFGLSVDRILMTGTLFFGMLLLYVRSGRGVAKRTPREK